MPEAVFFCKTGLPAASVALLITSFKILFRERILCLHLSPDVPRLRPPRLDYGDLRGDEGRSGEQPEHRLLRDAALCRMVQATTSAPPRRQCHRLRIREQVIQLRRERKPDLRRQEGLGNAVESSSPQSHSYCFIRKFPAPQTGKTPAPQGSCHRTEPRKRFSGS